MLRFAAGVLGLLSLNLLLQTQQDPKVVMAQVRERVLATVDRLPNYMCTQTIDRAQYAAIREQSSKVLVPEGAKISGRIIRMRRFYGQSAMLVIAVKLETLDAGGTTRPFSATVDADSAGRADFVIGGWNLGPTSTLTDSGVAVFEFQNTTANPVIRAGLESKWDDRAVKILRHAVQFAQRPMKHFPMCAV